MYLLYIAIGLIVFVFIYSAITRKKIYSEVDRLEEWKLDILKRPIAEEIGKVKGLKMSGETEEKFETWRTEWDEIVDGILPDLEEDLFDVEEFANKYRFNKAKKRIAFVENQLNDIETQLKGILEDIDRLINSEEQNREEIGEVKKYYQEVKKYFSIHRGSFGKAADLLAEQIESTNKKFLEFDEATEQGNYLLASSILSEIKDELKKEEALMRALPKLLVQFHSNFPAELDDLAQGINEMGEAGYAMEHFGFDKEIERMKENCLNYIDKIERLELDNIEDDMDAVSKQIDAMYQSLEDEVLAKQWLEERIIGVEGTLEHTAEKLEELKAETESVQQSYRITEEELKIHQHLNKQLKELKQKLSVIDDIVEHQKQSFTATKELFQLFLSDYQVLEEAIEQWSEKLLTLRKEEMLANDTLKELKSKLLEGKRLVQKSNIPGLPLSVVEDMERGEKKLLAAFEKLSEVPLAMNDVIAKVEEARESIDNVVENIEETIEKANMAEKLIQYGNRYRSNSDKMHTQLIEAELAFRSFYYDDAIEIAEEAIKPFDPDVREKITEVLEVSLN